MKPFIVPMTLAALFLLLPRAGLGQKKGPTAEQYYPLKVGTTWTYRASNQKITMRLAEKENKGDAETYKLETSVNGRVLASESVGVGADGGLYRYAMTTPEGKAVEAKPPILFLKWPYQKDQKWEVKSKAGEMELIVEYVQTKEEVVVPAGKYTDVIVTRTSKFQIGPQKAAGEIWYAKGVGMVKMAMTVGGNNFVMELTSFERGQGK